MCCVQVETKGSLRQRFHHMAWLCLGLSNNAANEVTSVQTVSVLLTFSSNMVSAGLFLRLPKSGKRKLQAGCIGFYAG